MCSLPVAFKGSIRIDAESFPDKIDHLILKALIIASWWHLHKRELKQRIEFIVSNSGRIVRTCYCVYRCRYGTVSIRYGVDTVGVNTVGVDTVPCRYCNVHTLTTTTGVDDAAAVAVVAAALLLLLRCYCGLFVTCASPSPLLLLTSSLVLFFLLRHLCSSSYFVTTRR